MVETKQDIGLSILTSSAVFGAWSAWNSSLFTASTFVTDGEKYANAKLAMDLGLATAAATGLGVHYVYGSKGNVAAASAIVTGVVLYAAYWLKLKANPVLSAAMAKEKAMTQETSNWKPLTDSEIQRIRNINNPIKIVSDP